MKSTFADARRQFPAIIVTGPRQAGKTTFLRHEAGDAAYVSFDDPLERAFALSDPNAFLDQFADRGVILDEIQYLPELLPYIKLRIDRKSNHHGRWLLTGSQQFHLMKNVGESLAGRVAILELLPFSLLELGQDTSLEEMLWNGGYPAPALHPAKRDLWLRSYIQTYIERDVRQLQNIQDLRAFELFTRLSAAFHGQTFNAASFARECGVSLPTIKAWGGLLQASYLSFILPPYFRNYGKRLVKTPKQYLLDPALAAFLTRQPDAAAAISGPLGGALFEGLIVAEAVKVFTTMGKKPDIFFWRSHDGLEVDLIIQTAQGLVPVEIKLTATPSLKHLEPLGRFKALAAGDAAETGILVCRVKEERQLPNGNIAIPWQRFPEWLRERVAL